MMPAARTLAVLLLGLTAMLGPAGPASAETGSGRLYLLAADTDYLYWGTDPQDPESALTGFRRTCGLPVGHPDAKPCSGVPGGTGYTLWFAPAAILDGPVAWGPERPLAFRLALAVSAPSPFTVHLAVQGGGTVIESPAASETGPGVWEGLAPGAGQIPPGTAAFLGVRVRTDPRLVRLDVGTGGASWVDLPDPVPARSVPELLAADTYRPARTFLVTPERRFTFNDDAWELHSFTGDLGADRTFVLPATGDAATVIAWIEGFAEPILYDLSRGETDPREPTNDASIFLYLDGERFASGRRTLAHLDVPAGVLSLEVNASQFAEAYPYTARVLLVRGLRTLASMRWRWSQDALSIRAPVVSSCAVPIEPIPSTSAVATFRVELDWDSPNPQHRWTFGFVVPGHSEQSSCLTSGTGDAVRFVAPGARVSYVSAIPPMNGLHAGIFDDVLEADVRFTYAP